MFLIFDSIALHFLHLELETAVNRK